MMSMRVSTIMPHGNTNFTSIIHHQSHLKSSSSRLHAFKSTPIYTSYHTHKPSTHHQQCTSSLSHPQSNKLNNYNKRTTVITNNNTNSNDSGFGPGGPESINDPILHDFLFGMGSSGEPYERPADAPDPLTEDEVARGLSMGSWRLRSKVCPHIELLAGAIENIFRSQLRDDLGLCTSLPQRFKYLDSLDPVGCIPLAYEKPDPPTRDNPQWPRLQIENRAYSSYAFRKLHLEVAIRQDGLQVFHCVMYPRINFDLPILSLDMVAMDGRVTLAIIDPCPVTANLTLPPFYQQSVDQLRQKYNVLTNRGIPEWGNRIFSRSCVCMRPENPAEVGAFMKYAIALCDFHVQIGRLAAPVREGASETEEMAERRKKEIRAAHERYCAMQLENDKTKRVLAKSFGDTIADEYMRVVMFDVEE